MFDSMMINADVFCDDEDDDDERFPATYAEIDYEDMDDPEAVDGMKFDDMNYLRRMER